MRSLCSFSLNISPTQTAELQLLESHYVATEKTLDVINSCSTQVVLSGKYPYGLGVRLVWDSGSKSKHMGVSTSRGAEVCLQYLKQSRLVVMIV